jgi:hypothetical protein
MQLRAHEEGRLPRRPSRQGPVARGTPTQRWLRRCTGCVSDSYVTCALHLSYIALRSPFKPPEHVADRPASSPPLQMWSKHDYRARPRQVKRYIRE